MPDPAAPAPGAIQETPPAAPQKFAGKYETPDALSAGYREIRGKLGLKEIAADKPLFGKDGLFADVTALERGYEDLETMIGRSAAPPATKTETPKPGDGLQLTKPEATVEAILTSAGLKGEDLGAQWQKAGYLTPEQYKALADKGYPKATVDSYMQGQAAIAQNADAANASIRQEATRLAGGEQQLESLIAWADAALSDAEHADLNARLKNPKLAGGAIRQMMHAHAEAVGAGKTAPLISGSAAAPSASGFTTLKDLNAARDRVRAGKGTEDDKRRIINTDPDLILRG